MNPKFSISLACALTFCLASCTTVAGHKKQVVTANTLRKGTVTAAPTKGEVPYQSTTVWNSGDPKKGCDVTITYHGEQLCEAHLEYVSPADPARSASGGGETMSPEPAVPGTNMVVWPVTRPLNPFSSRRVGAEGATLTLQNVTEVRLICGDSLHSGAGECAFSITDIDCSRNSSQVYLMHKNASSLARVQVAGPSGRQVVWTAPQVAGKASPCSVTALLRGSKFCNARVWTSDVLGNVTGFEFAREEPGFVTFHNIAKLELECGSTADKAVGDCLVEVVQTECDK